MTIIPPRHYGKNATFTGASRRHSKVRPRHPGRGSMTYGVGMVGRVRARVGELENTPVARPQPQLFGPKTMPSGSTVVPHSGLGLLSQLFDTHGLNTTREEKSAHFPLVCRAGSYGRLEVSRVRMRRRDGYDRNSFSKFSIFSTHSTPISPLGTPISAYVTLTTATISFGGLVRNSTLAHKLTRSLPIASSKGT